MYLQLISDILCVIVFICILNLRSGFSKNYKQHCDPHNIPHLNHIRYHSRTEEAGCNVMIYTLK